MEKLKLKHTNCRSCPIPTPCIEEAGLPAEINNFLLALFRPAHKSPQLFQRRAVVELHHVGLLKGRPLNSHYISAVVIHHCPYLIIWKTQTDTHKTFRHEK